MCIRDSCGGIAPRLAPEQSAQHSGRHRLLYGAGAVRIYIMGRATPIHTCSVLGAVSYTHLDDTNEANDDCRSQHTLLILISHPSYLTNYTKLFPRFFPNTFPKFFRRPAALHCEISGFQKVLPLMEESVSLIFS